MSEDRIGLQDDFHGLENTTKMSFETNTSNVLQSAFKQENSMQKYTMGNTQLGSDVCEKDLKVLVDHKLNTKQQCNETATAAATKSHAILIGIKRIVAPTPGR